MDEHHKKDLEDQLEAEQYFSTLYKTQVRELQDEVDEARERQAELERERDASASQLQAAAARADSEALSRRVAEEDIAELEKEKMMIELELKEVGAKHRADARNLEMQLATLKDTESDLLQKIDQLSKDNTDLHMKLGQMEEDLMNNRQNNNEADGGESDPGELAKLQKLFETERMLKQQAVNKLAEIMNRKDFLPKKDKKADNKAVSDQLRRREKENRKLQLEQRASEGFLEESRDRQSQLESKVDRLLSENAGLRADLAESKQKLDS